MRLCKFCKGEIARPTPRQLYCSSACKAAAAMLRRIKAADDAEGQRRAATIWAERREKNLVRCVCKFCMLMDWTAEPYEFCSPGCRIIHYGGNPQKVRKKDDANN